MVEYNFGGLADRGSQFTQIQGIASAASPERRPGPSRNGGCIVAWRPWLPEPLSPTLHRLDVGDMHRVASGGVDQLAASGVGGPPPASTSAGDVFRRVPLRDDERRHAVPRSRATSARSRLVHAWTISRRHRLVSSSRRIHGWTVRSVARMLARSGSR